VSAPVLSVGSTVNFIRNRCGPWTRRNFVFRLQVDPFTPSSVSLNTQTELGGDGKEALHTNLRTGGNQQEKGEAGVRKTSFPSPFPSPKEKI
jgi:hypothetical protein